MADIPEKELEESRAALAPTMAAIASILPLLSKPRPLRFDSALNQRWIEACTALTAAWGNRFGPGTEKVRPAIFDLYRIAIETADAESLRLGEALASAADQLECFAPSPRLIAAIAACIESLGDKEGLEHPAFSERASHFAQRLESVVTPGAPACQRSAILDSLFVSEANELMERMQDALERLPPDAYALKLAAAELAKAAENAEMVDVMQQACQLVESMKVEGKNLDDELARKVVSKSLEQLAAAIAAVNL